ncbi:MAG: 3-phosphoshikimate 1-carboxyvinyltransferase [Bacteroidota bacterium]
MKKYISPSLVNGKINAPASKSYLQRAVIAAMLAQGRSVLHNCTLCDDSKAVLSIAQSLGAKVIKDYSDIIITGGFQVPSGELNCHESGLALRMLSPIVALLPDPITVNGSGSLLNRPIELIIDSLSQLNIKVISNNHQLPITIDGNLLGGNFEIDGSNGSQLLTGLLMALPLAQKDSIISVKNLKSKPYIDITIDLLREFGICIYHDNYQQFRITGNQSYKNTNYNIEGDWSSAAFMLVAGAIAGEIEILGVNPKSKQADIRILDVLKAVGAEISVSNESIIIKKNNLIGFDFDAEDCPDLFPPLVALAANCKTPSTINGVSRLYSKESNRAVSLQEEFNKIGVSINIDENRMIIKPSQIKFNTVNSHNDHRVVMATAVAALCSEQGIEIEDYECINKSYPDFFNDLHKTTQHK